MQGKINKILLCVFLGLVVIAIAPSLSGPVDSYFLKVFPKKNLQEATLFQAFDFTTIKTISITKEAQSATLNTTGTSWVISGKRVDALKIADLISSLKDLKLKEVASKNPQNYAQFGVDDKLGYLVEATNGVTKISVIVGSYGELSNTFYLRKASGTDQNVYLISGSLRQNLSVDPTTWRDKNLINVSKDTISKVVLSGATTAQFDKTSKNWSEISGLFSPLDAFDFVADSQNTSFENTAIKTTVTLFDSADQLLGSITVAPNDSNYYVKASEGNELASVYGTKLNPIFKPVL